MPKIDERPVSCDEWGDFRAKSPLPALSMPRPEGGLLAFFLPPAD
jgi:hypothetical protein